MNIALGCLVLSLLVFLPYKNEQVYILEDHIQLWPYIFLSIFIIITIVLHKDKIMPRLTEGIILMQSISMVYWVLDKNLHDTTNRALIILMGLGLLLSLFAIVNALTYLALSRTNRLILSIWSSVIMAFLALDYVYTTFQYGQIEATSNFPTGLYIGLQYFLLGISSIYIVHNFFMLIGFLPGRSRFFNSRYFREVKELAEDHINRFSDSQASKLHSFIYILVLVSIFYLNYYFQIVPRNIVIWTVFFISPMVFDFNRGEPWLKRLHSK